MFRSTVTASATSGYEGKSLDMKDKIRNFRCTDALDQLLIQAASAVECAPSWLLREFVREGSASIINDPKIADELRRKCAVS